MALTQQTTSNVTYGICALPCTTTYRSGAQNKTRRRIAPATNVIGTVCGTLSLIINADNIALVLVLIILSSNDIVRTLRHVRLSTLSSSITRTPSAARGKRE